MSTTNKKKYRFEKVTCNDHVNLQKLVALYVNSSSENLVIRGDEHLSHIENDGAVYSNNVRRS